MSYSKKTRFYRIPVMGKGDVLTEENEMRQMTIIDNLLYATTYGCSKCVIEEGRFVLRADGGNFRLHITAIDEYSLLGILNYRLFMSAGELVTQELMPNLNYYVYAEYTSGLEIDPTAFALKSYPYVQADSDQRLLICMVDTLRGQIKSDVDKVYAKNILAHTADRTNPHGKFVSQDIMSIEERLSIQGFPAYGSIYDEVLSGGEGGVEYEVDDKYKVVFVNVYAEELSAGAIAYRLDDGKVTIFNSGDAGVKLYLQLEVVER